MAPIIHALLAAAATILLAGCSSAQSDALPLVMATPSRPQIYPVLWRPGLNRQTGCRTLAATRAALVTWPLAAVIPTPIPQPIATAESSPGQLPAPAVRQAAAYAKIGFHTAPNGGGRVLGDWLRALDAARPTVRGSGAIAGKRRAARAGVSPQSGAFEPRTERLIAPLAAYGIVPLALVEGEEIDPAIFAGDS